MRFKYINIYSENMVTPAETKSLTKILRNDSAHISEMYERLMKYYDNTDCKQLNIACDVNAVGYAVKTLGDGFPVLSMPFDLNAYKALQSAEISRFWTKAILESIRYAGTMWGWDLTLFERVAENIEELGYVNEYQCGKYVKSPYDSRKAVLWVEQCLENTRIYLAVYRGRAELERILVKETEPPVFCYSKYLGEIEWISESGIRVLSRFGEEVIFECLL